MNLFQHRVSRINSWLLILLAFFLPLSTSGITVTAILIIVCWLLEGGLREKWREIVVNPVCIAVFVYLSVMLIGLFWTHSFPAGFEAIRGQWQIFLLPLFLTTVRWERRWWYVAAFIAGITIIMVLIDLTFLNIIHYNLIDSRGHLTIVGNQIIYAPMLALAIYLLMHQVIWGSVTRLQRWLMLALIGLMIPSLFISVGRAGQVVFFILFALLVFQYFRQNLFKASLLILVTLPLIFTAGYRLSPIFRERVDLVQQNIMTFEKNQFTAVGLRLLFWQNSWEIIRQSPWFGVGTGGFVSAYAQVNRQRSPDMPATDNPHNQYILSTVQQGLFGLLSLLTLFLVQIFQARLTTDGWQRIRLAFPLFFLVIMMTDSYLKSYSSGFLFSLFSAVFFKSKISWQLRSVTSVVNPIIDQSKKDETSIEPIKRSYSIWAGTTDPGHIQN